ncbi:MAG: peroxidase family protein, partial [Planctomycetota bacterium]|nr:peroxidase family protein [Planctomycetota bacterium]
MSNRTVRSAARRIGNTAAIILIAGLAASAGAEDRTLNGVGNNVSNPDWGAAETIVPRITPHAYSDGVSAMARAGGPSARDVSNAMCWQVGNMANDQALSDMVWQWGQFLDHDLGLTGEGHTETFQITTQPGDPTFLGNPMNFFRSIFDPSTGTGPGNPREQINLITAFIDASNVYGSNDTFAAALRTLDGTGKLKVSNSTTHPAKVDAAVGDLLPFNEGLVDMATGPRTDPQNLHAAGDVRANEQVGLTAMHTLWVREHNRLCDELAAANPTWTGEEIYQRARKIVGALNQIITYQEFLPTLIGDNAIPAYAGYNPSVDPATVNIFSHAAYRLGHTLLSGVILRLDNNGAFATSENLLLRNAFFQPEHLHTDGGIDPVLKGLATGRAQRIDARLIDDVRNMLFGPPGVGLDLASLNIQRGRDHGLPDLNTVRVAYGLAPHASFNDISSDPAVGAAFASVYASVNDIDPWVGLLAEDHVPGANVGETLQAILVDQVTRVRDGDRFWYANDPELASIVPALEATTLRDVIQRNTGVTSLQPNVFIVPDPGDINGDGLIGAPDLAAVLAAWGPCPAPCPADLNGDG